MNRAAIEEVLRHLRELSDEESYIVLLELIVFCQRGAHIGHVSARELLRRNLITAHGKELRIDDRVRRVVLNAVDGDDTDITIVSPLAPCQAVG